MPRIVAVVPARNEAGAVGLDDVQTKRISTLIDKLSSFIGSNVGVLTGGGGGVMRVATDQARGQGALTGACFLELEAQPPEFGVDFFNTFQETSRHFRQKFFDADGHGKQLRFFDDDGIGLFSPKSLDVKNTLARLADGIAGNVIAWIDIKFKTRRHR